MGSMSKRKGKRGELEAAELLRAHGFEARRGAQFRGGPGSPDVMHSISGVHVEVKRCERLDLYAAMDQAGMDSGGKIPVVLHRRNGRDWLAILPAHHLLRILKETIQ